MNTPKLQNQNQSRRASGTNSEAKTNTGTRHVSFVQQDLPQTRGLEQIITMIRERIRNQKHGACFSTVLRGHPGPPKPGL